MHRDEEVLIFWDLNIYIGHEISVAGKEWKLMTSKGIMKVGGKRQLQEKDIYRFQRNTS